MEQVVRSGKWSWMGEHERAFCDEFAKFLGVKHCMLLANGTVPLQCALQALGVTPGDEVIVPALTWVATAQAALEIGANVVLVDIDPETYCIDPAAIEAAITAKTKAIISAHLYGCMCDMEAILNLASRHGLKVVEDTAHQHGSRWHGRAAGALGDVGSFSFQQSKILTCGEGGALVCNDDEVYEKAFCLKHVGCRPDLVTPGNHYGRNYRATEMQAVLLRGGLERLPEQIDRREENVALLREKLEQIGGPVRIAKPDPRVTCQSYYGVTLHYDTRRANGLTRSQYIAALAAEGCQPVVPYPPVDRTNYMNLHDTTSPVPYRAPDEIQDYANLMLPVTERVCGEEGLILMHTCLHGDRAYVEQVVTAMQKVSGNLPAIKAHFEQQEAKERKE